MVQDGRLRLDVTVMVGLVMRATGGSRRRGNGNSGHLHRGHHRRLRCYYGCRHRDGLRDDHLLCRWFVPLHTVWVWQGCNGGCVVIGRGAHLRLVGLPELLLDGNHLLQQQLLLRRGLLQGVQVGDLSLQLLVELLVLRVHGRCTLRTVPAGVRCDTTTV